MLKLKSIDHLSLMDIVESIHLLYSHIEFTDNNLILFEFGTTSFELSLVKMYFLTQ